MIDSHPACAPAVAPIATGALRALLREPLAHFLAIGLAVFALDRALAPVVEDPRLILLDDRAYGEIVDIFAESAGRAPTPEEMAPLADRWLMNEVLYREARALRLEEGDEMVRERIMQKMRVLIHSGVAVEPPPEPVARDWFERNRALYDHPAVISLQIAQLDADAGTARGWAERLAALDAVGQRPPLHEVSIYPFEERPVGALAEVLGEPFVTAASQLPPGVWTAMESPVGWQAVRLDAYVPARVATYEEAAAAVASDWREHTFRRAARDAIEALQASYRVERAPYDADAFASRALSADAQAQAEQAAAR